MIKLPTIGYHGTAWANVPGILRHGLRFPEPSFGNCGDTIWVASKPEYAASSGPAIFEVNFEGIKGGWYPDEPEMWQAHLFEPIPPDRLRLITAP